jgi:tetratricopeptide (TPR) repeat protein
MNKNKESNINELFNEALKNHKEGNFQIAKQIYKKILRFDPKFINAYQNLGIIYGLEGENKKAKECYEKVIEIDPNIIIAQYNLGLILNRLQNFSAAKKCFKKVIEVSPDFLNVQYYLGLIYQKIGRYEKAKKCYENEIQNNSGIADVYNNLGIVNAHLGNHDEAIKNYINAIKKNSLHKGAKENLIISLTSFKSNDENIIVVVNNNLKKINKDFNIEQSLDSKNLHDFFKKTKTTIKDIKNFTDEIVYKETQTYRRNIEDLNCKRHHKIFNEFNIIPNFCFSCFKIQIEPKNVLELIKLFFIFDKFKFSSDNWRKCMIELRPEVSGSYKGLIYCKSLNEAEKIINELNPILKKFIKHKISIKRGCSEFYKSFPNFKNIYEKEDNFMKYDNKWKKTEKKVDDQNNIIPKKFYATLPGFSISDLLIMNHWFNYAKFLNDFSYNELNVDFPHSDFIFNQISNQINFRKKEFTN